MDDCDDIKDNSSEETAVDKKTLRSLQKPNLAKILFFTFFNLGTYLLLFWIGILVNNWLTWFIILCLQGFILSGFIAPAHECVHNNLSSSIRINRLMGVLWSLLVLLNFSFYKYKHIEHHKHTNILGDTSNFEDYSSLWSYLLSILKMNIFNYVSQLVKIMFGELPIYMHFNKARCDIQIDNLALLVWIVLISISTITWTKSTILFYWCPLIMSFPSTFLTAIPEHYGCDKVLNPLYNTRTILSNSFVRCVMWNANYHAEHHIYPSVPSHNLSNLHALVGKHLKFKEYSYFLFHMKIMCELYNKDTTKKKLNLKNSEAQT